MEMEIEIGLRFNQGSLSHTRECNHWQLMPGDGSFLASSEPHQETSHQEGEENCILEG